MFFSVVRCLTEQYFLHKPNAWYSNLSKSSMTIWNAINYWSCCKRLVTTVLVHRQPLGHRMFFQKHLLGHIGLWAWHMKEGWIKSLCWETKASTVLFPEHGVLLLSEHCVTPATLSHLWQPLIIFLARRARLEVSETRYSTHRSYEELTCYNRAVEWVGTADNLIWPCPVWTSIAPV